MSNKPVLSAVALAGLFLSTCLTQSKAKALSTVSANALVAQQAESTSYDLDREAFRQSTYSQCDVRKYAWWVDESIDWEDPDSYGFERYSDAPDLAEAEIGGAVRRQSVEDLAAINRAIASVGNQAFCDLTDSSLWYRDYQAFAAARGIEVNEAKALIAEQLTAVGNHSFIEAVSPELEELGYVGFGDRSRTDALLGTYADSGYGYCDAKKVAEVWGVNTDWAKSLIGNKLVNDRGDLVTADIASTANTVRCGWEESGLNYDTAVLLADYWGVSVADAKARTADEISRFGFKDFNDIVLVEVLGDDASDDLPFGQELAPEPYPTEALQAFASNGFQYCDAVKLAALWGLGDMEAKARAGQKIIDTGSIDGVDAAIRSTAQLRSCDWGLTDMEYADVERLAQYWGVSVLDAKTRIAAQMSEMGGRAFIEEHRGIYEGE